MFEQMCYLIVCRQKANSKRRRLLYKTRHREGNTKYKHKYIYEKAMTNELIQYRQHADFMKEIAKTIYSPLRRSLNIKVKYDSNNATQYITYQSEQFSYRRIQEIAASYEFDTIVLDNARMIANPYIKEQHE